MIQCANQLNRVNSTSLMTSKGPASAKTGKPTGGQLGKQVVIDFQERGGAMKAKKAGNMMRRKATVFDGRELLPESLPWYALNGKDQKDQWYTKREVAKHCMDVLKRTVRNCGRSLRGYKFIEPAAGEGCFTDCLPKDSLALDIDPKAEGIQKADFLAWTPPAGKYAVVGNPPFGVRGALALAFVNRSARFADWIAFILPMTFESLGKGGARTRVMGANLAHSEELPPDSFYDSEQKDRSAHTVFQVWSRLVPPPAAEPTCHEYAEIRTVCSSPNRRCGMQDLSVYDCFIASSFFANRPPKPVKSFDEVLYGSGYGVIIKKRRRDVLSALRKADWLRHSSQATHSCRHVRMQHIRRAITSAGLIDGAR